MHAKRKILLLIIFVITVLVGARLFDVHDYLSVANVKTLFEKELSLSIFLFVLLFSIANLLYIPGWVFLFSAILVLGKIGGGSLTFFAALISCFFSYFIVGLIGHNTLREIDSKLFNKVFSKLDQRPILCIAVLRVFFQTNPALNYTLSMSGTGFKNYALGTLIGLPLPVFLYCLFFDFLIQSVNSF